MEEGPRGVNTAASGFSLLPDLALSWSTVFPPPLSVVPSNLLRHLPPEFAHYKDYTLPSLELLDEDDGAGAKPADKSHLLAVQNIIVETLSTFGIQVKAATTNMDVWPTLFELMGLPGQQEIDGVSRMPQRNCQDVSLKSFRFQKIC